VRGALARHPGVASVAQIGNELRVLTVAGFDDVEALRRAIADTDAQLRIERVTPSLEDVFVAATQGRAQLATAEAAR